MGTSSTVRFGSSGVVGGGTEAAVYVHYDGYPEGMRETLRGFFEAVERDTGDHRYGDPTYLAAKFVVWVATQYPRWTAEAPLDFLGVGVVTEPARYAVDYDYVVDSGQWDARGRPTVWYRPMLRREGRKFRLLPLDDADATVVHLDGHVVPPGTALYDDLAGGSGADR